MESQLELCDDAAAVEVSVRYPLIRFAYEYIDDAYAPHKV